MKSVITTTGEKICLKATILDVTILKESFIHKWVYIMDGVFTI